MADAYGKYRFDGKKKHLFWAAAGVLMMVFYTIQHISEVMGRYEREADSEDRLKEARAEKNLSQAQLAGLVGVSRNTISSIETGQFNPTAKLALILCIALDKKFEELFYF